MKIKYKYRIVVIDDESRPFMIQRKRWLFWKNVDKKYSIDEAEQEIRHFLSKQAKYAVGSVVGTYTEEDLLVDKLRGK